MSESPTALHVFPLLSHALWPGHQPLPRGLILGVLSWGVLVRLTPQDAHWLMSVHLWCGCDQEDLGSTEQGIPSPPPLSPARSSLQGMVRGALVRGGLSQGEAWADWGTYSK